MGCTRSKPNPNAWSDHVTAGLPSSLSKLIGKQIKPILEPAARPLHTESGAGRVRAGLIVVVMGKFITRRHRGDKELQERVLAEANRLYETRTPLSTAIDGLIELADGNPRAFGLPGQTYGKLIQTPEGEAITRLMLGAEMKRTRGFDVPADSWWPGGN